MNEHEVTWRVASVESLPFPEQLFKQACALKDEHRRIVDETPEGPERYRRAFERFVRELGPRMQECEYHRADWTAIAAIAVEVVESGKAQAADPALAVQEVALASEADTATACWAYWLFAHSIRTLDQGRTFENGQHRVCAMKAAKVTRCPVQQLRDH